MGQQYGAAQPIADFFHMGKTKAKSAPKKIDLRWHEQMVKRANEDLAKLATKKESAKKEPMLGSKKKAKGPAKKKTARKR